jgi:hypothetical protein
MISSRSASVGPPDTSGPDCRASALGARTARTASRDGWVDNTKGILRGQTGDWMGDDNVRWHGLGTTRLTIFVRHAFPHIYSIYFYYCYSVLYPNKINRKNSPPSGGSQPTRPLGVIVIVWPNGRPSVTAGPAGACYMSSKKLPHEPAGHRSSWDLPALVIHPGNFRCRSGRGGTVPCLQGFP